MKKIICSFFSILFFVSVSHAQQSSGTLIINIDNESFKPGSQLSIHLIEKSSLALSQKINATSAGDFTIHDLPFASYQVQLFDKDLLIDSRTITISSSIPVHISLSSIKKVEGGEVTIEANTIQEIPVSTRTYYTALQIEELPAISGSKKIESILLNTPGAVPDEDGRMHFRGEDAQMQFIVDGIPITTNPTRIYSSLFNANLIKSANILRGGLNAEYGVATSAIVAINSRSGFDNPLFADGSVSYGSFGTKERTLSLGGNIDSKAALFFSYASGETHRYLDPIRDFEPNHTDASTHNYFVKADILLGDNMDLVLLGSRNIADFGIPNGSLHDTGLQTAIYLEDHVQNQRQHLNDYLFAARLNIATGDNSALSILGYKRRNEAENTSGGLMRISSSADSTKAIIQNENFFIGAHRVDEALGVQAEFAWNMDWLSLKHNFKAGLGGESYPLQEFFTFAVVNPDLSNPDSAGGDDRLLPYDLTKGGQPFLVDAAKTGKRLSAFVQDQFFSGEWAFSAGIRYDMFSLLQDESGISPRVGVAFKASDDLSLRLSYNRIIMQAPLENILVSSSEEARKLVGAEQGTTPINVLSEKEHVIEIGAAYKINDNLDLDFAGYSKFIENFIVKVELGSSGVIFPVNLKEGMVAGGELQLRLHHWNNISAGLGFTTCLSVGKKPEDGFSPIAAGLIFGEEGENYSHPFGGEDQFPTEHNQLLTGTLNIQYDHPSGFFAGFGGRFDSGLPFDLADDSGNGMDADAARTFLKRKGYTDEVIDLLELDAEVENGKISPDKTVAPHIIFDAAVGFDFEKEFKIPAKLSASVVNLLDTKYLYKFESSFGGTHFGIPRSFLVTAQIKI
jgi:outer membrane receptor protein involved in Fe transport